MYLAFGRYFLSGLIYIIEYLTLPAGLSETLFSFLNDQITPDEIGSNRDEVKTKKRELYTVISLQINL